MRVLKSQNDRDTCSNGQHSIKQYLHLKSKNKNTLKSESGILKILSGVLLHESHQLRFASSSRFASSFYKSKNQSWWIQDGCCSTVLMMTTIPSYITSSFYIVQLKGNPSARAKAFLSFVQCHNEF